MIVDVDEVPPPVLVPEAVRARLLELARVALAVALHARPSGALVDALGDAAIASADLRGGAFVTLTSDGDLRGCMGAVDPDRLLAESVSEAAFCAARMDPRFLPVAEAELSGIEIEVSVLGPMIRLSDPLGFRPGTDGVVVQRGGQRGLLLPEVAPKLDNDRISFLEVTCRKAGLPAGAWRDPTTTVYAFRTARFGGHAVV